MAPLVSVRRYQGCFQNVVLVRERTMSDIIAPAGSLKNKVTFSCEKFASESFVLHSVGLGASFYVQGHLLRTDAIPHSPSWVARRDAAAPRHR
eukprot:COSAG06_NODE_43828_length_368_cov_1.323420_1_plen_92_part_01